MPIPTEPIGSIPRPVPLIEAIKERGFNDPALDALFDEAIRDTIARFEATGSPVITDGEQRKYHNFGTYWVDGLSKILEGIHAEYEKKLAAEKKTNSKHADEVVRARRELESTEASVTAARARLAELLNQQATLDPRRRLGVFLEERVQSTQYRSQQGIISLVHKDFSELSKYMKDLRESPPRTVRPRARRVPFGPSIASCSTSTTSIAAGRRTW